LSDKEKLLKGKIAAIKIENVPSIKTQKVFNSQVIGIRKGDQIKTEIQQI
jgi:hypothetical protein